MAVSTNGIRSEATVMSDSTTDTNIGSVLIDILSEMRKSNDQTLLEMKQLGGLLANIKDNTKDNIKEMVWHKAREDKEPIDVLIRTSFVSVGDIDAIKQEFKCEFYLSVEWKEPALKGKTQNDVINWENYWDPAVYVIDAVSYDIFEKNQKILPWQSPDEAPTVKQYFRIKGTFKEILEVNDFPFDYQDLQIVLTSSWDTHKIRLRKSTSQDDNIRTWNFTGEQEWELQKHVLCEETENIPEFASSPNIFPLYKVKLHVKRKFGFYLYNIAFLMCLITLLTFTTFVVEVDAVGDRLQITLTLLLTSVAFKYYVQQFLPTVSYLTFLDKYILACLIFQFCMAAIHNATSGLITSRESLEIFEVASFEVGLAIFLLLHVVFGAKSVKKVIDVKKKAREHKHEYLENNKDVAKRYEEMREKEEPNVLRKNLDKFLPFKSQSFSEKQTERISVSCC